MLPLHTQGIAKEKKNENTWRKMAAMGYTL